MLFGPVTLRNYRGPDCPVRSPVPPDACERALPYLRSRALLENLYRYSDGRRVPWIHLMDGGISVNLALRVLLNDMLLLDLRMDRFAAGLLPILRCKNCPFRHRADNQHSDSAGNCDKSQQ